MAANEIVVDGATEFEYFFRNYGYTDILSDMPILSMAVANDLGRIIYKTGSIPFKIMVDASGATNLADGFVMLTSDGGKANVSQTTETELMALDGIEGNIQDQLDDITVHNWFDFIPQALAPDVLAGRIWFDEFSQTIKVHNDKGVNLEFGRTLSSRFTAEEDILKGESLYASQLVGPLVYGVKKASSTSYNENWVVGVAANSALSGEICEFMQQGFIIGSVADPLDTSGYNQGPPLYFGTIRGKLANSRPGFPAEPIISGASLFSDPVLGVLGVNMGRDRYQHEFDGIIIEEQETEIKVEADNKVYMYTEKKGGGDLPVPLGSMIRILDCTTIKGYVGLPTETRPRAELVQGTVTTLQQQTVYIDLVGEDPVLKATTGSPTGAFARVSTAAIRDFSSEDTYGQLGYRDTNSSIFHDGRGRAAHTSDRFALMPPEYISGVIPTATLDQLQTPDSMNLTVIAGVMSQTHEHTFPALSVDTNGIFVVNGPGGAGLDNLSYHTDITALAGWTTTADARNTSCTGNVTIAGVINKSEETCKLIALLPSGLQGINTTAGKTTYDNTDNDAIFTAPQELGNVAFLICRIPYRLTSAGNTLTFLDPDGNATTDGQHIISLLKQKMGQSGGGVGGGAAGIQNLAQVLSEGNDAGNVQIKNGADGTDAQDFITLNQHQDKQDVSPTNGTVYGLLDGGITPIDNDRPARSVIVNTDTITAGGTGLILSNDLELAIFSVPDNKVLGIQQTTTSVLVKGEIDVTVYNETGGSVSLIQVGTPVYRNNFEPMIITDDPSDPIDTSLMLLGFITEEGDYSGSPIGDGNGFLTKFNYDPVLSDYIATVDGVGTGTTEFDQVGINTTPLSQRQLHLHGGVGDSVIQRLTTIGAKDAIIELSVDSDGTPLDARIGFDQSENLLKISHGSGFSGSANGIEIDSNGVVTAPMMSISDIDAAGDKALVTKEYNGEFQLTVPASGTVIITSTNTTWNNNSFALTISQMPFASGYYMDGAFGTNKTLNEVTGTIQPDLTILGVTNGFSFQNSHASYNIEITIKAIGLTDITQLIVS